MEADASSSLNPPAPEEASQEDPSPVRFYSSCAAAPATAVMSPGAREAAAAMEAVERDAAAIAESYASLFASLRITLSNVLAPTSREFSKFPCF
ncbi:hypothetical protein D1007_45096 [Hordeum vulgare]|nr:hypothetical protein D1007_45096 [Hordeum vulgare]